MRWTVLSLILLTVAAGLQPAHAGRLAARSKRSSSASQRASSPKQARARPAARPARERARARLLASRQRPARAKAGDRAEAAGQGLTLRDARRSIERARRRLGVDFRLDWKSDSRGVYYTPGKPVVVSRWVAERPGMTADALDLLLAHEAAHAQGMHEESEADYWAARHGLRQLWGPSASTGRALAAAESLLRAQAPGTFRRSRSDDDVLQLLVTGYPTTQWRWNLYRRGALGEPPPSRTVRAAEAEPELMTPRMAARYLDIPAARLAGMSELVRIETPAGARYVREDLDRFRQGDARLAD